MQTNEPRRGQKAKSIPTFLRKLFEIMRSEGQRGIVEWGPDGLSFEVLNREAFTGRTLPFFFKHNKLSSFIRQLNMYEFHKCKRSADLIQFRHPFFQRDRPELLCRIKRKTNSDYQPPSWAMNGQPKQPSNAPSSNFSQADHPMKETQPDLPQPALALR